MTTESSNQLTVKGNREEIKDHYVPRNIENEQQNLRFKVFIVRSKVKTTAFRRSDLSLKPFAVLSCKDGVSIR